MNTISTNKAAMQGADTEEGMNSKPPDYDQFLGSQHRVAQANHQMQYNQQLTQGMYQPTFPMNNSQNAAWVSLNPNFYQM